MSRRSNGALRATQTILLLAVSGCVGDADVGRSTDVTTFEEFRGTVYREPWEGGVWIVDGDVPIQDERHLREHYDRLANGSSLIVHRPGGIDAVWNSHQKRNLTYCVSTAFGSRYAEAVEAMRGATEAWEQVADVAFIHLVEEDGNCNASNPNVVFDVRMVSGQPYLARAFFPDFSRSQRNILVDTSAFEPAWEDLTLEGILRHEVGHTLGFRHEHTRSESGAWHCYEDSEWRALTPYDRGSTMHYPGSCGGDNWTLALSPRDAEGAATLYGPPGDDSPPPPPPTGENRTAHYVGSLAQWQQHDFGPFHALPGTLFSARMTGTGIPDMYVRFGAPPTVEQWDCRPYVSGADETCDLDVPESAGPVYVMIRGYTEATYSLQIAWRAPLSGGDIEVVETFDNRPLQGPRYADRTFDGVIGGVVWSYVHGRDEDYFGVDGAGVMLRRGAEPSSLTAILPNGIRSFAVDVRKGFTSNDERRLELLLDGEVVASFAHRFADGSDPIPAVFSVENLDRTGPVQLTLRVPPEAGTTNRQVVLDNLRWTSATSASGDGATHTETFDHRSPQGPIYGDGIFEGVVPGVQWSYVHGRDEGIYPVDGAGVMLRRGSEPSSLTAVLPSGIRAFAVDVRKAFTGDAQRRLELVIDGEVVGTFAHTFAAGDDPDPVVFAVDGIDRPGPVELTVRVPPSAGTTNRQVTLDNLTWTSFE